MKAGRELISQKKRQSTDLICLILFIFFTLIILIAGIYFYTQGSTSKYSMPYDSDGKGCGVDYPGYNFIYFPSPQVDSLWVTTCVKACPGESDKTVSCKTNSVVTSCDEFNSADNTKAFNIYETETFRDSVCLPKAETVKQRVVDAIGAHFTEEMFGSVLKDWSLLLLMVPIAALVSLFAVFLIRVVAGYVVYFFYAFIILALIGIGVYLVLPVENRNEQTFILKQSEAVGIGIAVVCFLLSIILLFVFISYREKIKQTVSFIDKSNEFFRNNYSIILLPVVLTGCSIIFLFLWLFLALSFYSYATPVQELNQLPYQHFKIPVLIVVALVFSVFYLIWTMFFLMHTGKCIVSGSFTSWKFNRKDPYLNASKVYLTSHIGSACMSSFLTALFGLFKFEVDDADCAEKEENQSKCTSFFSKCYGCLCCCCVTFIFPCFHRAAFAYLNLSGLPYCQSSFEVTQLIKGQKVGWGVVALLHGIFSDLIPLLISVGGMLLANYFIDTIESYHNSTANRILVLGVVALLTYTISQFFLTIYSQAMQTSFILQQFYRQMPNKQKYPLRAEEESPKKEISRFQPVSPRVSKAQK